MPQHPFAGFYQALLTPLPGSGERHYFKSLSGSLKAVLLSLLYPKWKKHQLCVLADKESAAYFYNDLENLLGQQKLEPAEKSVLFFPTSYRKPYDIEEADNANVLSRSEVLSRLGGVHKPLIIVTYPEALCERIISMQELKKVTLQLRTGENLSLDFITDVFHEYGFERVDFVVEAGQYAIRGGLVDVFSYADDYPYRMEFDGDVLSSIRSFDPSDQLSVKSHQAVSVLPNIHGSHISEKRQHFLSLFGREVPVWIEDTAFLLEKTEKTFAKAEAIWRLKESPVSHLPADALYAGREETLRLLQEHPVIEFGLHRFFKEAAILEFNASPQPLFHKNFELLLQNLDELRLKGYRSFIMSDNPKQIERLQLILEELLPSERQGEVFYEALSLTLHEGFIDHDRKIACFTDHQLFDRYHRFRIRESFTAKEAMTINEMYGLKPGDYVTHIDHGVGRFDGLEIIENNGRKQEAIRLFYKNNDILYVSIHSLHRISRFTGQEGSIPQLDKLGSGAWQRLKDKTKRKVKDIARDLIKLYAQRRKSKGFAFSADSYLQRELEASFIYEDTPDQLKATADIKQDLEADFPMDRLVCGDVGFGKTEVAIRAAFKVVADSRQVAVLVPTTILALQHFHTFSERLGKFPCRVDYINRFRSTAEQKQVLKDLEAGKTDILIGTHRLLSEDVKFKNLGLLVLDEEQKFGVAAKEKLKKIRVNVDTLTLTATPIPRTLQFSLMGARDLSIISTPPPNRQPVQTELTAFNEEIIRNAIHHEISRGGQVFFVHNRIQNITEVAGLIRKTCPDARVAVAHGQMEGHELEKIMMAFIEGLYDVLVATTIIESGLDIPNANTIFINEAHHHGLSDLHQLRGRVGRSNRKAFCYLLAPPLSVLTEDARKRLQAVEEFSDLGSGFNIAMRDLDIRGAGNILGAEQSGFIAEIGFEMYQKILDEAIFELKQSDFPELAAEEKDASWVKECSLETDLELLIPPDYVNNTTERLHLYKELDNTPDETKLMQFQEKLIDRFGPVPPQTAGLFNALRMRWLAREAGFEKIVLRNQVMTGYFIPNPESPYYQSQPFSRILAYVQANPRKCSMKEGNERLSLTFKNIRNVQEGLEVLRGVMAVGITESGS